VLKEKIYRYYRESMLPHKLVDIWISNIQITIGKVTWHAILDLGSSVSSISKKLYDQLEIGAIENVTLILLEICPEGNNKVFIIIYLCL
jgi:hypothetical protein